MSYYRCIKRKSSIAVDTVAIPGTISFPWKITGAAVGGVGYVQTTNSLSSWDKGGSSVLIPANTDFEVSFTIESTLGGISNVAGMAGVSISDTTGSYVELQHAFQFNGSTLRIYEQYGSTGVTYGDAMLNDSFKMKRVGTVVSYYWNNALIYTSEIISTSAFLFDTATNKSIRFSNIIVTIKNT